MMLEPAVLESVAVLTEIDLPRLLSLLNERIECLYGRDHLIGHAYFIRCETPAYVDEVMRHKFIRQDFLLKHGFSEAKSGRIFKTVLTRERHPIEGVFDLAQRFMMAVWPKLQKGVRLVMEYKTKAPLQKFV